MVAIGRTHSIRDFLDLAFAHAGIADWQGRVVQDERFLRPAEVDELVGDATKAREVLGWRPQVDFPALVAMLVDHDLAVERAAAS